MKKNELYRKNVIVTGGSGFIGKALVNRLNSLGARVLVLDSSQNVDISNWNKLKGIKIIKNCEILYHLAAKSYVPYSWTEPHIVYTNNVLSTLNILELCRLKKINKLVYMSSYIYGRPEYLPIDEAHPVSPNNPYAWSKLAGENLCRGYAMNFGLQCIILRPFNVYGPGQKEPFLIPTIMAQFFKNKKISINDLRPKRDFLYIDDLIEALISCKNYRCDKPEIFNIGYGQSYSVNEIIKKIGLIENKKLPVNCLNLKRKEEIMNVVADISKAKRLLVWKPRVTLEKGLKKICDDHHD